MIVARGKKGNGESLIILGLSDANVKRMADGRPMIITRKTHGDGIPEGWEIVILTGKSEQDIYNTMKAAGLIAPQTVIHKDARLGGDGT